MATKKRTDESRSGTPTVLNEQRKRPMTTITLSPEAHAELERHAKDEGGKSGHVERLIMSAAKRKAKR